MTIRFLQPVISPTGIRYILDNEGRQIATISSLLDGVDNAARAKESEHIHNAICDSFNSVTALRAELAASKEREARLQVALKNLVNASVTPMTKSRYEFLEFRREAARRALESHE